MNTPVTVPKHTELDIRPSKFKKIIHFFLGMFYDEHTLLMREYLKQNRKRGYIDYVHLNEMISRVDNCIFNGKDVNVTIGPEVNSNRIVAKELIRYCKRIGLKDISVLDQNNRLPNSIGSSDIHDLTLTLKARL